MKLVFLLLFLIVFPKNVLAIAVSINRIEVFEGQVFVVVELKNNSENEFHIETANLCSSELGLLRKPVFEVREKKGQLVKYKGMVGFSKPQFLKIQPRNSEVMKCNLTFDYGIKPEGSDDVVIQYKVLNARYKDLQAALVLQSNVKEL